MFDSCEICSARDWTIIYEGPIRDGVFGKSVDGAKVARRNSCGVERLAEAFCPSSSVYETEEYRASLGQDLSSNSYFKTHDHLQIFALETLWPRSFRDKIVADIGCAGGSYLNHVSVLSDRSVAVEPCTIYHESLSERGYEVFPYAEDASRDLGPVVDLASAFQVIEHLADPRKFLHDIRSMLSADGLLLLSTPNRRDILMQLLPDDFAVFFYRTVHRWYFDADSLARCAELAGYRVVETNHVHRYGMSNTLAWLRDRRPTGHAVLDGINKQADDLWSAHLEATGQSDTLFMLLAPDMGNKQC